MSDPSVSSSPIHEKIKNIRVAFQGIGAVVCVLFAVQGVAIVLQGQVNGFWEACNWISELTLYIGLGLGGFILEIRLFFKKVRQHFASFALNRLGIGIVYLWIGCYSMGSRYSVSEGWLALGKVTGVLAWVVGAADILMSCCSDRSERRAETRPELQQQEGKSADGETRYGRTTAPDGDSEPARALEDGRGGSSPPASSRQEPPPAASSGEEKNPFEDPPPAASPPGGWATVGSKPFGCS